MNIALQAIFVITKEVKYSYLQRLHGVQRGQQVRRHHSHPAVDKSECFISLALFHAVINQATHPPNLQTSLCKW